MKNIDLRNRDSSTPITFKQVWLKDVYEKLLLDPEIKERFMPNELKEYLLEKYSERRLVEGRLYNNATLENTVMNQERFINKFLNEECILSGYAAMFENQDNSINVSAAALESLGELRKFYKKKMEAAEHGSAEYIYYRILQLTYKVLMNSYYGILGERNSVFYNPFVQNSITMTGQDLITTSIIAMESFLSNNVLFEDTDDVLTFISNVRSEDHALDTAAYINIYVSNDMLLNYLISRTKEDGEVDYNIVGNIVKGLTENECIRIYYKNNLIELLKNRWFEEALREMTKYEYAEKPAEEIKGILAEFKNAILEFAFYDRLYEDRYKRATKDKRKSIIVVDTDSNFINLNNYIEFVTEMLQLNSSNEKQQLTIMNIFIDVVTETLKRTFWTITTNMGLIEKAKPIINMKNEFVYKKIMTTRNKKNYGGIITSELGNLLSKPVLDIKGLAIKKTSVPKKIRKEFTKILEEDILKADEIDLHGIIEKYDALGKDIGESLKDGKTDYVIPKNVEVLESYKNPSMIESVRAVLLWNVLEPENQIILPEKINIVKLKPGLCEALSTVTSLEEVPNLVSSANASDELKNFIMKHPEKAKAMAKAVYNIGNKSPKIDYSRFGVSVIAIPKGEDMIPEYIRPFIDTQLMINANMANGYILLESIGIYISDVSKTSYKSNIIQI